MPGKIPANWEEFLATVAFVYKFPPSELWEMSFDEVMMWDRQARRFYG